MKDYKPLLKPCAICLCTIVSVRLCVFVYRQHLLKPVLEEDGTESHARLDRASQHGAPDGIDPDILAQALANAHGGGGGGTGGSTTGGKGRRARAMSVGAVSASSVLPMAPFRNELVRSYKDRPYQPDVLTTFKSASTSWYNVPYRGTERSSSRRSSLVRSTSSRRLRYLI